MAEVGAQPAAWPRASQAAAGTARKAWRFAGEMDQIAACFAEAGLPDGFAGAAAELYRRLATSRPGRRPAAREVLGRVRAQVRRQVLDADAAVVAFGPHVDVTTGAQTGRDPAGPGG